MPGGCFVEGDWLRNAFRWKETIGPWEERPGHFGDVWHYWTDDGLGHFEFLQVRSLVDRNKYLCSHHLHIIFVPFKIILLQLAEDLGTSPIWVFNNGTSYTT